MCVGALASLVVAVDLGLIGPMLGLALEPPLLALALALALPALVALVDPPYCFSSLRMRRARDGRGVRCASVEASPRRNCGCDQPE